MLNSFLVTSKKWHRTGQDHYIEDRLIFSLNPGITKILISFSIQSLNETLNYHNSVIYINFPILKPTKWRSSLGVFRRICIINNNHLAGHVLTTSDLSLDYTYTNN